jgi:hypothetical protein
MKMNNKKVPVHSIFTGVYFLLALITLLPMGTASKISLLGYKALCSFTPISTIILLALGGLHIYLQLKSVAKNRTV